MALMHVEVFEALRSVMPEDKAIEGAARLYRAVSGDREPTNAQVREEAATSAMSKASTLVRPVPIETLTAGDYPLWVEFSIVRWMLTASILLQFIITLKVFSNP